MINSKNRLVRALIESRNGLHLTVYQGFTGQVSLLKNNLERLLLTADEHLDPVLSAEEKVRFLAPVRALAMDTVSLEQIKGNLAIFRRNDFFGYISLPIEVEETCVVASTFHVKPLLKWVQHDKDFVIVAVAADRATIFRGSQTEFRKINDVVYPNRLHGVSQESSLEAVKSSRSGNPIELGTMEWLSDQVQHHVASQDTKIFVAGDSHLANLLMRFLNTHSLHPKNVLPNFSNNTPSDLCMNVRSIMSKDSRARLDSALRDFELAHSSNSTKTNVFAIAAAAVKGNVKRLLIAEDVNVFGKLDLHSGSLSLHPTDMDHENDCLLDDIAQTVLISGGDVVVARRCEIPQGRPVMAVLKSQPNDGHDHTTNQQEIAI